MSENQEMEIARLESFRAEIKGIVEKVRERDATAALIQHVEELDTQEMALWEDLKKLFLMVDSLDIKDEKEILKVEIHRIADLTKKMMDDTDKCMKKGEEESKESKINFAAWINNKNPRIIATVAVDVAKRKGAVAGVRELRLVLKNAIDFYAKGGWKKAEVKT